MKPKTKYILHGGAAKRETEDNKKFFREISNNLQNPVKILIVCFAKDKEIWDEVFTKTKQTFFNYSPEKQFQFNLASEDTNEFVKQIKWADALYMLGGRTRFLRDKLAKIENIEDVWKGKVIAGSSAGALVLTKYWYENDDDTFNVGLGIFNFKLFCHYSEDKSDKLEELRKFREEDIEVRTIKEEKYFIIEN